MKKLTYDKLYATKMWRLLFLCPIFFILSLGCVIWGSITASFYAKNQHIRTTHTNTTCLLLDYRVTKHLCQTCDTDSKCSTYPCFDEILRLSYPIFNGSYINGICQGFNRDEMHEQQEVGFLH